MKITKRQIEALNLIPDNWGIPKSSQIHNGTLFRLIQLGLIEWDKGIPHRISNLNHGCFKKTDKGISFLLNGSVKETDESELPNCFKNGENMKEKSEFDKFRDMVKVIVHSPKPKPTKKKKRAKVSKKTKV